MRDLGSIYSPANELDYLGSVDIGNQYDGLLFVDTTTRVRPNPSVKNVAGRDDK